MNTINMLSRADMVKGQGVLSAHDEQVNLVEKELSKEYVVFKNKFKCCDIMHYHTINPEFLITLPIAKLKKCKCVGYVHFLPETVENSLELPRFMKKIFYWYLLFFYKRMDYLVTVNPYFIDVLEKYGVKREKVTYIPNFVSEEQFYPVEGQKKELRRKYKLKEEAFTVLCVGQLQTRKGVMEFLKIAERLPHMQFAWAGSFAFGKISDGYKEIQEALKNLPPNVTMLGLVDRENMNEIYNLADVMFLPSFEELFPMTILEAMNCGVPILTRDLPIYKDILFDFCIKRNNNEEFELALRRLEENQNFYEEAATRAFEGHEFYSRNHVANMWEEFYGEVLGNREKKRIAVQKGGVMQWDKRPIM